MPSQRPILVTGASGFIATHIVEQFFKAGYAVRVPGICATDAFDEAVRDVAGIIHTASPFQTEVDDNERELIRPAIEGTLNILNSVGTNAPQAKRVVITSSICALLDLSKGNWPDHTYTEEDWNSAKYEEAAGKDTPALLAYCHENPKFDLATICPPFVYCPNINVTADITSLNFSSLDIYRLLSPKSKPSDPLPSNIVWDWVCVCDVALAYLRAYEVPEAGGHRFPVRKGAFTYQQTADILRENIPDAKDRVPAGNPGAGFGGTEVYKTDSSKSEKMLGITFHELQQTVLDAAKSLLALENRKPAA